MTIALFPRLQIVMGTCHARPSALSLPNLTLAATSGCAMHMRVTLTKRKRAHLS
jgi:hypothetical protein